MERAALPEFVRNHGQGHPRDQRPSMHLARRVATDRAEWLRPSRIAASLCSVVLVVAMPLGCMALSPQLPPTDFAALEQVSDPGERERLYEEHKITVHETPEGRRYAKGTHPTAPRGSWQSLDVVLRSDASSAQVLSIRSLRRARILTALSISAAIVTVAGIAASSREGLNLQELDGRGALLLGGALATLGFGIGAGLSFGRAKPAYERAVSVYNESLGLRLGRLDAERSREGATSELSPR